MRTTVQKIYVVVEEEEKVVRDQKSIKLLYMKGLNYEKPERCNEIQ